MHPRLKSQQRNTSEQGKTSTNSFSAMLTVKARFMPFTVTLLVSLQKLIFLKQDCKNYGTDFEVNLLKKKKEENASVILIGMSSALQ
jgi:hypothetical protein